MIGRLLEKDLREVWDNPEFIKKVLSYLKDDKDKEKMMEAIIFIVMHLRGHLQVQR